MSAKKKQKKSLTAFTILVIILAVLSVVTYLIPDVTNATLADFAMSPVKGFADAIDVCVFVMILGGFLQIVATTGALDAGIKTLVKKMHGNELILIPILMTIFSIGGSTYGMLEETVPFYLLLAATMYAAGFDSVVGAATILLGAGSGVLGSTVNPFAVGAAVDAINSAEGYSITVNNGIVIGIGAALWISSLLISIFFVMKYAKKVKEDKGSTILSLQERETMHEAFSENKIDQEVKLSGKQKIVLVLFAFTFVVMVLGFIPWWNFNVTIFNDWTSYLTGLSFGDWYFQDTSTWFLLMSIVIGVVARLDEHTIVNEFIKGAGDMMSVVLVIALARGASVIMATTGLDAYILDAASKMLEGMSAGIFAPLAYFILLILSFLVPSSSGLASLAMPVMGPLAYDLGFSVETMVMIFVAANGLINLFTPTCGAIMGGLAIAKVEYSTWLKFAIKIIACIAVVSVIILTACMLLL